jgi:ribosomal protein S18 acetylase RimI-like enzyme
MFEYQDFVIREASVDDAESITELSHVTFHESWDYLYADQGALQEWLDNERGFNLYYTMLQNTEIKIYLAFLRNDNKDNVNDINSNPVGYVIVGPEQLSSQIELINDSITISKSNNSGQIYQLYLRSFVQRKGLGKLLISHAINFWHTLYPNSDYIYVEAYTLKEELLRFYQREGFIIIGIVHFVVKTQSDDDYILRLPLTQNSSNN